MVNLTVRPWMESELTGKKFGRTSAPLIKDAALGDGAII
jgi:hypothetical protein